MIKKILTAALFCICLSALPAFSQEYLIGAGDLLKITVYDNPDLTTEARVSNDGKITFPLIGEVDGERQHRQRYREKDQHNCCRTAISSSPRFPSSLWNIRARR